MIYENGSLKMVLVDGGYYDPSSDKYYFYLTDHLGNNHVVADASDNVIQATHYYPYGMSFAESTNPAKQPFKYNAKELDMENGLNVYDYVSRGMDPAFVGGGFMSIDPLCEKYYSSSPYSYCLGNPVNCIDPDGRSTWVVANSDGTYRIVGGDINDNDRNIYVWTKKDGELQKGESIGESDLISSFYNSEAESFSIGSVIDPNDTSGEDFFNSFNEEEPPITDYMANATKGGKYDFKRIGMKQNEKEESKYFYRGMPVRTENGKTIYSSARDIGNYTAGYIAGHFQMPWGWARKEFDKLESGQKGHPAVEGYSTQNAEWHGWKAGMRSSSNHPLKTIRWTAKSIPGGIEWLIK